jgi:hypothetical protein
MEERIRERADKKRREEEKKKGERKHGKKDEKGGRKREEWGEEKGEKRKRRGKKKMGRRRCKWRRWEGEDLRKRKERKKDGGGEIVEQREKEREEREQGERRRGKKRRTGGGCLDSGMRGMRMSQSSQGQSTRTLHLCLKVPYCTVLYCLPFPVSTACYVPIHLSLVLFPLYFLSLLGFPIAAL